ncbi:hypothetical protein [Methylocapsa aurea]|uniref:hypothetical protein n=1 Tax=Methylocapsa aurea TaxID=663610 RepID=UPI0005662E8E|nr:hypothetical protein [Methylocapsa aurea]
MIEIGELAFGPAPEGHVDDIVEWANADSFQHVSEDATGTLRHRNLSLHRRPSDRISDIRDVGARIGN